ncbi:MAG: LysM peptidoglycan-binding domain-containing protein [Clostridia bacterium]|nr:LysM peptidoglycan-binding domain-containing protein [Clostridia bacterium]
MITIAFICTIPAMASASDTKVIEYTVKPGDTLYSISTAFGVNREDVLQQNGIEDRAVISVGQVLKIEVPLTEDEKQAAVEEPVVEAVQEPAVVETVEEPTQATAVEVVENENVQAPLGISFADNTVFTADRGAKIDFTVTDADIRDILSMFAIKLDVNIIYVGTPYKTSLEVTDVDATTAFEIFLKSSTAQGGLSFIREGDLVIVGPAAELANRFSERLVMTEFKLQYMKPAQLVSYLNELGVNLTTLILNENSNILIAQGFPYEIAKANEIVNSLDKVEYYGEDQINQEETATVNLVSYTLKYVTPETLKTVLTTLGLNIKTFTMKASSNKIWVSGTTVDLLNIKEVIGKVDIAENVTDKEFGVYRLKYVDIDAINNAMKDLGLWDIIEADAGTTTIIPSTVLSENPYVILINFTFVNKDMVDFLISEIDTPANMKQVPDVFIYTFGKITAQTAMERIDAFKGKTTINLDKVVFFSLGYMGYTKQLVVLSTGSEKELVMGFLADIDFKSETVKIVVDSNTGNSGNILLRNRIPTIAYLSGVDEDNFYISGDITKIGSPYYILWVEDTAENCRKVQEVITMIDAGTGTY